MPDDIPPIPNETHAAIVALIGRLEQSILEVGACAKASRKINKLRWASARSAAANAPNLAQTGVPVGSRVAGDRVYNRLGATIGGVTSAGSFVAGEPPTSPPFTRPAVESRNAKDQARIDKLFKPFPKAIANIRSLLGDLRKVLYSLPSDIRKEIEGLAIWRMAGASLGHGHARLESWTKVDQAIADLNAASSLWVGAAEPYLTDLRTLLRSLVRRARQGEMQADSQESAGAEISSAVTPLDRNISDADLRNISDADLYDLVKRKLGFQDLARQLEERLTTRSGGKAGTRSTLGAYARQVHGETPNKRLKPTTYDKIKATIRGIALDPANADQSFKHELLRLTQKS